MVRQERKFLVAEHSAAGRQELRSLIHQLAPGATIVDAATADEFSKCLKKAKTNPFDVILLGSYPTLSLSEMLPALSAIRTTSSVVLVTDNPTEDLIEQALAHKIYDCLTIPVTQADLKRIILRSAVPKDPLSVLVVDDTRVMRKVVMKVLNESQFALSISEAESCQMAVSLCRKIPYHCIFLDLNMPEQNGLEAAKQILKVQPKCQIVLMSSSLDEMDDEVRENGLACFFKKPFYPKDVDRLLHDLFGLQQPNLADPDFLTNLSLEHSEQTASDKDDTDYIWL